MAEEITVLGIVEKLDEAVGRFQVTGDKSSLKGTFSWAKGVAKKMDGGAEKQEKKEPALPSEVVTDEDPKEDGGASLEDDMVPWEDEAEDDEQE